MVSLSPAKRSTTLSFQLDFQELIVEANTAAPGRERLEKQREADAALRKLRLYLRLAHRWQC